MSGDRELMRFHDGELSPGELAVFRERLERDAGLRSKLRALGQTGELVREWAEARSDGFDIADQVMARIDAPRRSRAVELWLPAAAAVALAAAVTLMVAGRSAPVDRPAPAAALSPHTPRTTAALPIREPSVAIESVDFGEKPGTIFMVSGEGGETPVIWLTDPAPSRMPSL